MALFRVQLVASTGIEPVSGASETLILSIVLRGQINVTIKIIAISLTAHCHIHFIKPCAL